MTEGKTSQIRRRSAKHLICVRLDTQYSFKNRQPNSNPAHFKNVNINQQGNGENYIMRSLVVCTPYPILCGWSNREEWDGRGMWRVWGRGDPDVYGRIILRWIFRKWEGVVGTGWSWLGIGTGGGRLWVL
jgi:hypothetical protein